MTINGKMPTEHSVKQHLHGTGNRLQHEKSPYLLQHAHNPVNWYPWGEEAFEAARLTDKPIFLSIGYSTCHWCHVMERESFEDPEVAALMNDAFIAIKVDREERPDIDNVYMTATQMMTGRGGWPMTVILTPDREPFFAGTYFPKQDRGNQPGLLTLLGRIAEMWQHDRAKLLESAKNLTNSLRTALTATDDAIPGKEVIENAYKQLTSMFDELHSGFGYGPKFPTPHRLLFLLRYHQRTGDIKALDMVERTLQSMRTSGMYDHIGFGFHRYATDRQWLVPHFEKMLYDQALLLMAYAEAYAVTSNTVYATTAREIATYVLRDMTDSTGGFYSAEDADSDGVEGAFYTWTEAALEEALNEDDARIARKIFDIHPQGNFRDAVTGKHTGENILYLAKDRTETARGLAMPLEEYDEKYEALRQQLFTQREGRIHPLKDDKILADWNGLMIAALALAGRILDEPEYIEAARKAQDFMTSHFQTPDGLLLHRYRNGEASITGMAQDYAFGLWGLMELYQSTFDHRYLADAFNYSRVLNTHFLDTRHGGFFLTPDTSEQLLVRPKEIYDGAIPSANSVAAYSYARLARLTGNSELEDIAADITKAFSQQISRAPAETAVMMMALNLLLDTTFEVVIAGEAHSPETQEFMQALKDRYLPHVMTILRPTDTDNPAITAIAPFTRYQTTLQEKTTAYVCEAQSCKRPVTTVGEMLKQLGLPVTAK